MGLETVTYISDLVATNPPNTDPKSQGAAHLRNIKVGLLNSFPLIAGPVSASHEDLSAISSINPGTLPAVNGANITSLNASALASGTVADARLSSNVPLKNATNTFAASQTFEGPAEVSLYLNVTGAGVNEGLTRLVNAGGGGVHFQSRTDANGAGATLWSATRSGTTWGTFALTASAITLNGVNVTDYARLSQSNTFTNADQRVQASNAVFRAVNLSGLDMRLQATDAGTGRVGTHTSHDLRFITGGTERAGIDASGVFTYGGIEVGYRGLPADNNQSNGKVLKTSVGVTLSTGMAQNSCWVIYNDSASAITLTQGSGLTLRLGGTASTGNRTLLARGFATVFANTTSEYIVTGHVS